MPTSAVVVVHRERDEAAARHRFGDRGAAGLVYCGALVGVGERRADEVQEQRVLARRGIDRRVAGGAYEVVQPPVPLPM